MTESAQPRPPTLILTTEKTPTESIVRCTGMITLETAAQLGMTARSLIRENKCVVLDFSEVKYLDSSGVGMIVGLLISAKKFGCKLRFVNLSPRVKEIFTVTRIFEALAGHEEYLGVTPD